MTHTIGFEYIFGTLIIYAIISFFMNYQLDTSGCARKAKVEFEFDFDFLSLSIMSDIWIIPFQCDYNVKEVTFHTFNIKHKDNVDKETFKVEKSDGSTIKILLHNV